MERHEVIVVGGGPAGSSCAWRLMQKSVDVVVLDKDEFPRPKLCAGWITPGVVRDLEMDLAAYPHRLLTFETIQVHLGRFDFGLDSPQHSIRRYEFDAWLLERSGAPVQRHAVRTVERDGEEFVLDDRFRCRWLVGAGGTSCPVYRTLFRDHCARSPALQAATLEQEFAFEYDDGNCHLWFFGGGLPGYSWYVPKADGYLNVGLGGMSTQLKAGKRNIQQHWQSFTNELDAVGLVRNHQYAPKGHSYFLRGEVKGMRLGNAFVTGDAAGLASRDLCEGIGPAVRSGLRAADAITERHAYDVESIGRFTLDRNLLRRFLEYRFVHRGRRLARH